MTRSLACFCRALGCCVRRLTTLAISAFICPCPKLCIECNLVLRMASRSSYNRSQQNYQVLPFLFKTCFKTKRWEMQTTNTFAQSYVPSKKNSLGIEVRVANVTWCWEWPTVFLTFRVGEAVEISWLTMQSIAREKMELLESTTRLIFEHAELFTLQIQDIKGPHT